MFKNKFIIAGAITLFLATLVMYFGFNLNLGNLTSLGFKKDVADLEKYGCLFRDRSLTREGYCDLLNGKEQFKDKAQKASLAFDIPYSVLFCTALIESGLNYKARSGTNRGYGQFSPIAVKQLNKVIQKNRYKKMWEAYTEKPTKSLTLSNVMSSRDPEIPLGAIALYVRWMFDRIDRLNCSGCGTDYFLTEKKTAMMIAGYNWSPYKLKVMAPMSISEMTDSDGSSLPVISRNYIKSMRYCRAAGEFEKLRIGHHVQDKRIKECQLNASGNVCSK